MAVPGNMNRLESIGCNKLIQDGAGIVVSLADVLEELGVHPDRDPLRVPGEMNEKERKIYELVRDNGEISFNVIARECGMDIREVNSVAAQLEIRGFVVSSFGKVYIAK